MSAMKEVWAACSDAGTASLDGTTRYVYAIRNTLGLLRIVIDTDRPDSESIQHLVETERSVVQCGTFVRGFDVQETDFILLERKEVASC